MKTMRPAVLAIPLLAVVLTGCGLFDSDSQDEETFAGVTEIRLDGDNAAFTIRGRDAEETTVRRDLHSSWGDPDDSTSFDDGVLTLRGCGRNCRVEYTVDVPAGTPVRGRTSNGSVALTGLGTVDVASSNGRIGVEGTTGPIDAETSNGRIEISMSQPSDITARTSNGPIEVTVPEGSYRVATETSNGSTDIGVEESADATHALQLRTSNGDVTVTGSTG